jgi:16S rRNA (guanine527-N7)-methyltransferase
VKGPDAVRAVCDVSRETIARLQIHHDLLERWNPRINLVSKASLADAWGRHFADSAQLWPLRPDGARLWLDLGSGAGFPGLVVAAIAADEAPGLEVRLVESDQRKAAFLRTVVQAAELPAAVLDRRIEDLPPQAAGVVSARALAPLEALLGHAEKHRCPEGICLFPKGGSVHKEIADAKIRWRFEQKLHPSQTDPRGAIVEIGAINRV